MGSEGEGGPHHHDVGLGTYSGENAKPMKGVQQPDLPASRIPLAATLRIDCGG